MSLGTDHQKYLSLTTLRMLTAQGSQVVMVAVGRYTDLKGPALGMELAAQRNGIQQAAYMIIAITLQSPSPMFG